MKPKLKRCRKRGDFQPLLDPISATATERRAPTTRLRRCQSVEGWWLARGEAKGSAARVAAEKIKLLLDSQQIPAALISSSRIG
ncbi:hypothetical protein ERO13_A05G219400v2 [Gossypium hirsutum]|uniref:Uncharacterized protein isoform X2 n=1 Tax=Gossypium hirsutum TaxID=3635 RepID=A0ABM3BS56_GOSHI|nr:uncharacterized protein LOC121229481 isoform X2 [Gossypium hirsutum]KAG4200550.1 hypothetical protein ERO13_A05G219400v2 [Gossypium hirsutum]